jgi:hypothetical protein
MLCFFTHSNFNQDSHNGIVFQVGRQTCGAWPGFCWGYFVGWPLLRIAALSAYFVPLPIAATEPSPCRAQII